MGFEKEKLKQVRYLILFVAAVVLLIIYSGNVMNGLRLFLGMLSPFIVGGAIAFVLNIPLKAVENKLLKKWKGKLAAKLKRPVSILLSLIFVVAIIAFVVITVVPKLRETIEMLGGQISLFVQDLIREAERLAASNQQILEKLKELENMKIDWQAIIGNVGSFLSSGMGSVLSSTVSVASTIIGGVVNAFIGIVFAIYILAQKEKLGAQGHRILTAYLPEKVCRKTEHVLALLHKNFSSFISGQCVEAVILGAMFVVTMSIFGFPYALLIGVLIAFLALIPIVGAFVGCVVGAFLILMNDPMQALWFVVLFQVLQQIEGNLIYPRVVGNSVGLPSIWVLAAVSIGGSLFGIVGMLSFIPLVSTAYSLLRDSVNERNAGTQRPQVRILSLRWKSLACVRLFLLYFCFCYFSRPFCSTYCNDHQKIKSLLSKVLLRHNIGNFHKTRLMRKSKSVCKFR